ncbi:MAG: SDR family oxidoreductase, partial [Chloroflexi bacterium]|nr:SDR family oxidoreductase [Chloroflexota bacterium]
PWVHLCTAKSFQRIYTMGLSSEMANHGVRVVGVAPGLVPTEGMLAATDPAAFKALAEQGPLGRACSPEDVAAAVVFVASDEASFMTGTILPIDGGTSSLVRGGRRMMRPAAPAPAR